MITREAVIDSVQAALIKRRRGNQWGGNDTGFYLWVAERIGSHEDTVANWCYGKNVPDGVALLQLYKLFGPDFAQEVQGELTGVHCSADPNKMKAALEEAKILAGDLEDVLAGAGNGK